MRSAVVLILIMLMGGCITSSTAKHYFQLSPPASSVGKIGEIPAVLLIDTIACDEIYDDFRIVYRLSDFELNYYNDDFWVKKPPVMIRKFIRRFFEQQHIFVRIVDDLAEDEPDIVLKSS